MSWARKTCPRSCTRFIRICSKDHVFIFSFFWLSLGFPSQQSTVPHLPPLKVRNTILSPMNPECFAQWLGLEGKTHKVRGHPADLLAKRDDSGATVRSACECLNMGQREIGKSHQRKVQGIFQWKNKNQMVWVQVPEPVFPIWPWAGQSLCLWNWIFWSLAFFGYMAGVGTLWKSGHMHQTWPSGPTSLRTMLLFCGWEFSIKSYLNKEFLALNLVKFYQTDDFWDFLWLKLPGFNNF